MTTQDRLMTACGPLGVGMLLAGNSMAGSDLPAIDASEQDLRAYLTGLDPSWLGVTLEMLGLTVLLVFLAALSRRPADSGLRALVLAGGAAGIAVKLATALPLLAVWLRPEALDPTAAGLALDLSSIGFAATGALFALVTAGIAAAGVLPRWLSVLGGVASVALLAQVPLFREEFGLGFLLFMLWTIAAGVVLLRSPAPARPAALQPA